MSKDPAAISLGTKGGKIGGRAKTEAKVAASRENGKKGGRPKNGRCCALCGQGGSCAAFLSLLMRWGFYDSDHTNQFAHPECIAKEQARRKATRND